VVNAENLMMKIQTENTSSVQKCPLLFTNMYPPKNRSAKMLE